MKNSAESVYSGYSIQNVANKIATQQLINVFLFFTFFPYLCIVPLPLDTQPYSLVLAFIIFSTYRGKKLPREIAILLWPFLASLMLAFAGGINLTALRSIGNYASLFFISASSYYVLKMREGLPERFIKTILYIWFLVGFIQVSVYPNFLTFLLRSARTGYGRGVCGLAAEPTFYGFVCVFMLLLVLFHWGKSKNGIILATLLIAQILFFAQSSMAALFLIVLAFYYTISHLTKRNIIIVAAIAIPIVFILSSGELPEFIKGRRIIRVLLLLIKNPMLILFADTSGNDRFFHIVFSFLGFFENYSMPHGPGQFVAYLLENLPRFSKEVKWLSIGDRIMSGYGAALFELGFIGLAIPLSITLSIHKFYKNNRRNFFLYAMFLNTILLAAIPMAMPLIGFLIGYLCYYGNLREKADHS